jgi:hypothetical protein
MKKFKTARPQGLPAKIKQDKMYVGLPSGWKRMDQVTHADSAAVPEDFLLELKMGHELIEMRRKAAKPVTYR